MLGRFLIIVAMMLFGPLFIEVYLYHPLIAIEHDAVAVVPMVTSPLALFAGFLLLAMDNKPTSAIFAVACAAAIAVGVIGAAIHMAMHAATLWQLASDRGAWLGDPPPLVPLSFAAAGCLGLIPLARPQLRYVDPPPVAIGRVLYALAALCGLAAAIAAAQIGSGAIALIAVIAALGLGSFGFLAEIAVLVYPVIRRSMAARPS